MRVPPEEHPPAIISLQIFIVSARLFQPTNIMTGDVTCTEEELLALIRSGDASALSIIYSRYWQPLFLAAYNILKDKAASEDILQDVFLQLCQRKEGLHISISLKAYLYAATRYGVYRYISKGKAREAVFGNLPERLETQSPEADLLLKEVHAQVLAIADSLPEKCREAFLLSRYEHLSHKEIAGRLHISPKTVENQIAKALRVLRASLGDAAFHTRALIVFFLGQ